MPEGRAPEDSLRRILDEAGAQLGDAERSPFEPRAFAALRENFTRYASDLVSESIRVARRHHADTVSWAHVEHAADHLVTAKGRRVLRLVGVGGGILLGASASTVLNVLVTGQYSAAGVAICFAVAIASACMVVVGILGD